MDGLKNNRHRHDDALTRIGHREFERLLGTYYRGQGWQVEYTGTGSTAQRFDGGVDLVLRRDDEVVLVQCKHWNVKQVPHNPVHELLGIMVNRGATGAILVTSGEFTRAAIEAANRNGHVQLVDGRVLRDMLGELPEPEPAMSFSADVPRYVAQMARKEGSHFARRIGETIVLKLVSAMVGLVIMVIGVVLAFSFISKVGRDLQKSHIQQRPAAAAPAKPQNPLVQTTDRPARQSQAPSTPRPVIQVQAQTPEQIEAQRKRAAEALEIIKQTTPELGAPRN